MVEQTAAEAEAAHLSTCASGRPTCLLTVLLLVSRVGEEVKATLNSWTLSWENILGTDISAGFEPLYSPGVIFLIVAAFTAWLHHLTRPKMRQAARSTQKAVIGSALVLMAAVPIVRVFLNSGRQLHGPAVDAPRAGRGCGGEHRCGLAAGGALGRGAGFVRVGQCDLQPSHVRCPAGVRRRPAWA